MKLLGVIFIVVSAATVGVKISASLKHKCKFVTELLKALQFLKQEIGFMKNSLPRVFTETAERTTGEVSAIFLSLADEMQKAVWTSPATAMAKAVAAVQDVSVQEILTELAGTLGKYDVQAQLDGISVAQKQAEALLTQMEHERSIKSKTYETLAICAGLAAAIILV